MKAGTEAAFQRQVENLAGYYGWNLQYHTHDSRRSAPGFPDLVLVRVPEIIFAEIKGPQTRVTPDQKEWIAALQDVSSELRFTVDAAASVGHHTTVAIDAYIWRPCDFDEMHARLARGRARTEPLYRAGAA